MIASAAALNKCMGRPRVTAESERVYELRSQGESWRRIAKVLGIWNGDCDASVQVIR
jgi:hypothetical protein